MSPVDIGSKLAKTIDEAKTFASSANLRCGKNRFMVTAMRGDEVDNGQAKSEYAFIEMLPLTSEPNPQHEGDWMLEGKLVPPGTPGARLVDDGMNPNRVGEPCAVKANFTGNRAVAASKMKQWFLAAFNKREADCKPGEIGQTWNEASRQVSGWYVKGWKLGDNVVAFGTQGASEDWVQLVQVGAGFAPVTKETPGAVWKEANPLAGFIIDCVTSAKKKRKPNEKGAYVGQQHWQCVAPPGVGENTPEAMKKRYAEHMQTIAAAAAAADDDDGSTMLGQTAGTPQAPAVAPVAPVAPVALAAPPVVPVAPTLISVPMPPTAPAVDPNWPPVAPWEVYNAGNASWMKPGFVWKVGTTTVISEADYKAGKRG